MDRLVRRQIQALATAAQIKEAAAAGGMRAMREDGVAKVLAGITTIEEVERVTMRAGGERRVCGEISAEPIPSAQLESRWSRQQSQRVCG